jgi:hypothetical protein
MDESNSNESVAQQSTVPVSQFKCGTCGNQMMARIPPMRVYNFPEVSGVVMSHERMSKCPNCQSVYVPLIKAVKPSGEIELVWKVISTNEITATPAIPEEPAKAPAKTYKKQ